MFAQPQDLIQARQAAAETATLFVQTALDTTERLTALTLNTNRALFEDALAGITALLEVRDPQALIKLQTSLAQPAIEKALAYSRNVYEITGQTKEVLGKAVETQLSDANAKVIQFVDKSLKNAPAGSEAAVAAVKSAITAANNAYDGLNKAVRQVTDLAEAGVTAATESVAKVVAPVAAPVAKKAAAKKAA